jgi:signal transduction histidine kinase
MFGRLRWLAIVLPGLAVGAIELWSDTALDELLPFPLDTLLVVGIVVALAAAFSFLGFRRIDSLAGALAARNEELERRNATVRALNQVSLAITAISGLDRILQAVVDQARQLLAADRAVLMVDSGTGDRVVRAASESGPHTQPGRMGDASRLEVPLQRGAVTLGSLVVESESARSYDADDLETLGSLASQAAIAIENARLQERLREVAVIEERTRIAREMHDGLAQVLAYVNTKSQAVEGLLDSDRVPEARTQLKQLAAAARSIYIDVREAILGLRSAIDPGTGLVAAIEEYAARFAEASKLAVDVRASPGARSVELSEAAADHAFRVVQESLTNVRKHAAAHRATIDLGVEASTLVLRVIDDGVGMAPAVDRATDWPHYGLTAMRERASAAGGTITLRSLEPHGTEVRLDVPLQPSLDGSSVAAAAAAGSAPGDAGR